MISPSQTLCNKGLDSVLVYKAHQVSKFRLGKKRLNLDLLSSGIASREFVKAATAHKLFDDVVLNLLMLVGNDADSLSAI